MTPDTTSAATIQALQERVRALEREAAEQYQAGASRAEARRLEALGRLAGGVAHDFNNVLQVIADGETLIRMVSGEQRDPRIGRALDSIHRAAQRGTSLTQRLLAYGRRQPRADVTLDLAVQLTATVDLLLRAAGHALQITLHVCQDVWPVETDPAQLDVAIMNIACNARDAMPAGGRLLIAACNVSLPDHAMPEAAELSGDYVCLIFTDSGVGMSEEVARQAFEPFFTTKAVGAGTGLGLSQVYGFAVQSRGRAFIRRERAGTTIGLLLPASKAAPAVPEAANGPADTSGLAGLRLLCVEDDADVIEATLTLLRSLGVHVELAENADAAMVLDLEQFDVVLSDVMMPGTKDGVDFAQWLHLRHPRLPVILCSGYMLAPQRMKSLPVELLRKPFSLTDLVEAIRRAAKRRA